jgi:hypothetical protein
MRGGATEGNETQKWATRKKKFRTVGTDSNVDAIIRQQDAYHDEYFQFLPVDGNCVKSPQRYAKPDGNT